MRLNDFLSEYGNTRNTDYQKPVLDLLTAATRALNAYADNAGKPTLTYVAHSRTDWSSPADIEQMFDAQAMQKGQD